MKKQIRKIILVAVLAFCFQPISSNADCVLRNGDVSNGVCRSYNDDGGSTGYRCIEWQWYHLWGTCNMSSSREEESLH